MLTHSPTPLYRLAQRARHGAGSVFFLIPSLVMFAIDDLFNKCLQLTGKNGAQLVDRFGSSSSIGY